MTTWKENPDGTRTWHIPSEVLHGASMLDDEDSPELTEEQFDRLADEMRLAEEDGDADTASG